MRCRSWPSHAVSRPVVVDVTSEETGPLLQDGDRSQGSTSCWRTRSRWPASRDDYDAPRHRTGRRRAAGPVRSDRRRRSADHRHVRKLDETGDRVLRIDGCVSGTLMFVLSEVSAGRPFSAAVLEAMSRGYAEPDPRDDLSGRDAARKGLILARMLGYRGDPVKPDDLVPRAYAALPLKEFLDRLPELDDAWQARVADEARRHRVLRYVVSATPRQVTAGLRRAAGSRVRWPPPAARGTSSRFTRAAIAREPLVISGPGAGRGCDRGRHPQRHLLAGGAMTQESMLRLILTSRVYDVARSTPLDDGAPAVAAHRQPGAPEARGSAADLHLQASRRLQPDGASDGRASARGA